MKVVFFLLIIVLISVSFILSKKLKDGTDFLVPKGGIPYIIVAFTMAATQFGSSMMIGGVQQAQQQPLGEGFWPAAYTILAASASCFLNMLVAPKFRSYGGSVTPPDFIETRYGRSRFMRAYHSVAYICSITAVLVSQFVGFAGMGVAVGFSYEFSIILCALVVFLLAAGSGMLGVAVTDMIQYALIMILLFISMYFTSGVLAENGVPLKEVISAPFFPSDAQVEKFFYTAFPMLIGNLFSYEYFMRFMSCKGIKEARRASATAGIVLAVTAVPVALIGEIANRFYRGVPSESVFGTVVTAELPPVVSMLIILALLMAVLTSADSLLTSISGMVARDIYGGLFHYGKSAHEVPHTKGVAKATMAAFTVIASLFALFYKQILEITFFFSPLTSGTMFAPMIVGLFWKGASRRGAIISVICGAASGILHVTGVLTLFDRVAGPALIGTAAIIIGSLAFPDKKGRLEGRKM